MGGDGVDHTFITREFGPKRSAGQVDNLGQRLGVVTSEVARCCAGTASVFPFSLRRQSVGLGIPLAEPLAKRHGIVPAYIHYRMLVGLLEARVPPGVFLVELPFLVVGIPAVGTWVPSVSDSVL